MFKETPSFDNLSNLGFNVNPNMQDSTLRAMNTREQKQIGMYYWANSDRDQEAAKKARDIFGRGMVNIADKENAAYYAGLSELQDMGIANTPYAYFIKHNIPIPENLETDEDVYMYIGQKTIDRNRALKDATQKASEDLNELGEELPIAIASAVRGEELDVSKTFNPELREKLMELQEWDGVEQSLKRAQTAWLYMASYMGSPEDLRAANREDLRYIADSLKDDSGNIDERAMAAFQIAVESRAKEMQSWDGNFWKNVGFGLEDVSERWSDYFSRPDEPNADEERLYGTLLSAINTSVQAAEGTSNISKTLASFGYMTGEMTPALIAGTAASGASAVAGVGLIASAITAGVTTSATTYVPTANQAIASAYVQGKENPELQGRIEGAAEAAVEGLAGTIPGGIIAGKVAGKFITKAASYAAGSRLLSNTVTQSTLRFFGGNTLQGLGELAEEEVGSALSAGLNATFRAAGYNLTPEQYNFGKAWGEMPAHQVAAIFCYTSALGLFGTPSNIKASREFARNSDNLLMVGHSEAAARDITEKQYQADAEKESIITSDISIEEKAEKLAAIDERMDAYRADKYRSDVMEAMPEEIDRRKKRENDDFMLATEAMMYIQNGVAERALERANITASIPAAGDKVTFLLENKDSKTGEIKMEKRTVTKKQFASWLMTERNKELRQSMRNFQSQLAAKKLIESVQSSNDIKHEIINLHDAPARLITELKNHEAITITTLQLLADHAKNEMANLRAQGMSEQQARMQSSSLFKGVQLQHVAGLVKASQERQENEAATTSGNVSGITATTKIEHPAFRLPRMDGTSVIVYAEGRAGVNHIVEELLESHLAQELASGTTNLSTLAEQLKTIEKQLPGKIKLLPEGKKEYKFGDIVEAYSKIAQANFLYNEAYLPLDKGGHRLVQNILRNVQAARIYKVLGEAYKSFANSEKGKAYLANGGKSLVDIMNAAGFTLGSRFEAIQQEADKAVAEMEARNLLPSPKQEAEQIIQAAKDQRELAEINAKEADEPIVVTAEKSITGEREELLTNDKLTEAPEEQQAELSEEEKQFAHLLSPNATMRDFASYLSQNRGQVAQVKASTTTQRGEPSPAFVQGELLSRHVRQEELLAMSDSELEARFKKAMVDEAALHSNQDSGSFSAQAVNVDAQTSLTFESRAKTQAKEIRKELERLKGKKLTCENSELIAEVGSEQRGKLVSDKARNKSLENGFTVQQHMTLASNIDTLYKYAIPLGEYNDKNARRNVEAIFRFACPVNIDGQMAFALLTLKRTEGNKLYSLELEEINQLGGTLDRVSHLLKDKPSHIPLRAADDVVARFYSKVKEYFGENALQSTAPSFSIAATDNLEQRFAGNPLAERMSFYLHREAKRFARILGNKTPYDTAVNAIASANAVIGMLDKYVHTNKIPLGRDERTRLGLLQRLIEKYAQIIKVGGARSFNKISKAEQGVLDNILSEISTGIEEGQTKANAKERYQELVRQAAKGRVWALLSEMMIEAGDILDAHLKSELQEKMKRITKGVKIKRTPSKKLKGKMTAAGYRDLEQAVALMAMSQRAKQDEEEAIDKALRYLIDNVGKPIENLRNGTELLTELADRIERNGQTVTEESLNQQLTYYSNAVQIFGDIESKDYKQTKAAAAALYMLVNYHRTKWQEVQEAKTAHVKAHLKYFLDNTTSEMGRDNFMREVRNKANRALTFLPDSMMNTAQLFLALASFKGLQPLFNEIRYSLANAQTAREVHLRNIRQQELAAFGQIIGIKPAAKAGYTERQLGEISDKFDSFYQENNQTHQTDIVVKWMAENSEGVLEQREEKLKATNWELLGIILNYRQPHYKINAELHGFTQDVLDKIEAHIGEKLMTFGNAIQQIIVNDGTMQVYEEREGVPMRDEPLYFPGSININTLNTTREEPLTHSYHPAAMHDFLHTRVRHRNEIKATNAYAAYRSAIADRANYIYLDPTTDVITRLLAHNEFANRIKSLIGPNLFKQLLATISQIKGAGYQESSMQDTGVLDFAGALTFKALGSLSGNTASHIRQLSAVANAGLMPDIKALDIPKYVNLARIQKGRISITGVLKLDAFETRRRDNSFVNEMAAMDNNVKYSKLLKWAKAGVNTMDKLDVLANAVSATVVYNHKYDELKAMGHLSEAEIEKRCEQEVNAYVRLLAQPLTKVDKSALYWMVSNWALGRSLLFMSSEAVNKIGMLRANYIINRNNGHTPIKAAASVLAAMGMSVGLASFINESIISGLTGNTPDDDDSLTAWAIATYLNATIGQYLEVMPLVGAFSRQIFSPYGKLENDSITIPGSDFYRRSSKLWNMLTDDKDYSGAEWQKQITRFMRELTSVLGYAGGAYSRWQWFSNTSAMLQAMTTTLNSVYFVAQAATNKAEWTEILPESYTTSESDAKKIRQGKSAKPKRMKSAIEEWLTPESEKKAKKSKSGKTSKKTEVSKLLLL